MSNPIDTTAKSYLDFSGLATLRGKAQQDQSTALKETAQQFEALFIQMMMKAMRDATTKDSANESSARDTFEGMYDKEVSLQMAKRHSLGVANFLEHAVQRQQSSHSTAALLQAREPASIPLHSPAQPVPLTTTPAQQGLPLEKPRLKTFQPLPVQREDGRGT